MEDVWKRREGWYKECSSHRFFNHFGKEGGVKADEPARWFRRAMLGGAQDTAAVEDLLQDERRSYFLSIVDDYSRKVWVCLLTNKSEAFEKFKE